MNDIERLRSEKYERSLEFERAESGAVTRISFASDAVIDRGWFTEQLLFGPDNIDMSRLKAGVPFLRNHDYDQIIGRLENPQFENGRLYLTPKRGTSALALETWSDIDAGIIVDTSIGYKIMKEEEIREEGKKPFYRITSWQPFEGSAVSIPADISVGVNRSEDINRADRLNVETKKEEVKTMSEPVNTAELEKAARDQAKASFLTFRKLEQEFGNEKNRQLFEKAYAGEISESDLLVSLRSDIRTQSTNQKPVTGDIDSPQEEAKFSVREGIRNLIAGKLAGTREGRMSEEIAKRMGESSDKIRLYLPSSVSDRIRAFSIAGSTTGLTYKQTTVGQEIPYRQNVLLADKLGVQRWSNLVGTVTYPRMTAPGAGAWINGTTGTLSDVDPTLGAMTLSPKWVGGYSVVYQNMLNQTSVDLDMFLQNLMTVRINNAVEAALFDGLGASSQPQGISQAGIGTVTGTSLAWADAIEFQSDVDAGNSLVDGSVHYVTTPAVKGLLMARLKETVGTTGYIAENGMIGGYPVHSTNNIATDEMIFGDFSQSVIADWGAFAIEYNPYATFTAGGFAVRALQAVDIGVFYVNAFSVATSIT